MTRLEACEAQGARCGHIDGSKRVGAYVMGEEQTIDVMDHMSDRRTMAERLAFQRGYEAGYRVGADGEALDPETVNAPLPEECPE